MVGFRQALQDGLKQSLCGWLGANDENIRGLLRFGLGRGASNKLLSTIVGLTCDLPPLPGTPDVPFTGGQCDELYDIERYAEYSIAPCSNPSAVINITQQLSTIQSQPGPLTYLGEYITEHKSCGGFTKSTSLIGIRSSNGNDFSIGPENQENVGRFVVSNTSYFRVFPTGTTIDGCGDPPPGETPPQTPDGGWRLPPVNITYDNSDNSTSTVNISPVIFAPVVTARGRLSLPVRLEGPDLEGEVTLELGGEDGVNLEIGLPEIPGGDTFIDELPPPQDPDVEAPPTDEGEDERRIIGVVVTTTQIEGTPVTEIYQDGGNPDVFAPDLGLVSFAIAAGDTLGGWTADQRVKNSRTYIPCPAPQGANDVKGTPRSGVTWTLTPVYGARDRAFTEPV